MNNKQTKLLRVKDVAEQCAIGISAVWLYVKNGTFPQPFKLSPKVTVWYSQEIEKWINERATSTNKYL